MRKKVIKIITIALSFLISLVLFSITTNQANTELMASMQEASLPTISFYYGQTQLEELHGYVNEMEVSGMRDSILPLDSTREMEIEIATYGRDIDSITYQVRSTDGSRLVADGSVSDFVLDGQTIQVSFQVQNLLTEDEEYALVIILESDGEKLYYYSRIMSCGESDIQEYIDFVNEFHSYTFREDADEFIPTYMDENTGDSTTLQYVDLHCSLNQITWGSFEGEMLDEPVMSIKEILDTYTVITLQYVMVSVNEEGETEYYNVEEYYRLRNTTDRIYVLNFERTMNQIFRGENTVLSDSEQLLLGIRDSDVSYAVSEAGDKIAFVQEGELWCFDLEDHTLSQVFSFRSTEGIDARENWDQHDIKIVRIDEAGSVDFIVYGYMNRGDHEGEVGVAIYHYDALARTVEEEAFLPSSQSYEIVKAEMGQLMFENEQGTIYLMMEGNVYAIDLSTLQTETLVSGLEEGCFAVSESNRYLAWVDADEQYSSSVIEIVDLQSGKITEVSDGEEWYLLPLGFYGEDFIYGAAAVELVTVNAAGNTDFPMEYLKILDMEEDEVLKEYSGDGVYIEKISVESSSITVELMKKESGSYVSAGEDAIVDREADTDSNVAVTTISTDEKLKQVVLTLAETADADRIRMIVPKTVILEEARTLEIETEGDYIRYYVYAKGKVQLATDSISDAIASANDTAGVVVDQEQQYLWMRARSTSRDAITVSVGAADVDSDSIAQCISAILNLNGISISVSQQIEGGSTPKDVLEDALTDYRVLDLKECPIEGLLFYISNGHPVFAMTDADEAVLITGYTSEKIYCYNPVADQTVSYTYEDAETLFSSAGNIFFAYY